MTGVFGFGSIHIDTVIAGISVSAMKVKNCLSQWSSLRDPRLPSHMLAMCNSCLLEIDVDGLKEQWLSRRATYPMYTTDSMFK